jgi:hypothetical protein
MSNATAVDLPEDSSNNATIVTYDVSQLVLFMIRRIALMKARTNQLGIYRTFVFLMPRRIGLQIECSNLAKLIVKYEGGAVDPVMDGDAVVMTYDDKLIAKGTGESDAILLLMPEVIGTTSSDEDIRPEAIDIISARYC